MPRQAFAADRDALAAEWRAGLVRVCAAYAFQGKCAAVELCTRVHVGWRDGETARRIRAAQNGEEGAEYPTLPLNQVVEAEERERERRDGMAAEARGHRGQCRAFFSRRGCSYGRTCRFSHEPREEPCERQGTEEGCPWGERCRWSHSAGAPGGGAGGASGGGGGGGGGGASGASGEEEEA